MPNKALPKISSFVIPTDDDVATWNALTSDEQRQMWLAELDKASSGGSRSSTAAEIKSHVLDRRRNG